MNRRAGDPVQFKINLELGTVEAICHGDARRAAQRVSDAIEELKCERPGLEDLQLVEILRIEIIRAPEAA